MLLSALRALDIAACAASRPLGRRLREIRLALQLHSVQAALRLIDRTWRTSASATEILAPIYGRLLSLEDRDPDAALRVLSRINYPDADVAALMARAYTQLLRPEDALRGLDEALKTYAVVPQGLLGREASAALQIAELHAAGWIGRGPQLEFTGELTYGRSADSLQIRVGATPIKPSLHVSHQDGRVQFSFAAPTGTAAGLLHVSSDGLPLLGSGQRLPADFAVDGRTECDRHALSGWARIGWLPTQPVQLRFEDEHGDVVLAKTRGVALPGNRWPFRVSLRGRRLRGYRIGVHARLPDGRWLALPDTPYLRPRAVRIANKNARLPRWRQGDQSLKPTGVAPAPGRAPIDIIIPVYGHEAQTLACISSVLSTAGAQARVVVVDDASPDPALSVALDELVAAGHITLLRNESNLGFVGSVNRALAMNSGQDIVLLNSDTLVFEDWLRRLSDAAYHAPRVGTVTPFSNDGSIASYPRRFGGVIDAEEAVAISRLAAQTHAGTSAEIPVGVGFCLYIRHDCLQAVGELDAATFGVGYGEESDFCLRARKLGWSHRLAADVFVYHAGGGSFGPRRAALLERSQRLLNLRYPGYDRHISGFLTQDHLLPLRRTVDERRLAALEGRFVLIVTLALEGGVERFVNERKQQIRAQGLVPLVLKPHRAGDARSCELSTEAIDAPNLRYRIRADLPALTALLAQLRLDRIELQHFLDLDPAVIEAVRTLGVPYDVMIHDYAWICPRITLIDGSGRYCGEPAVSVCESCVRKNGSRLPKSLSVAALRKRSDAWLAQARTVRAPSTDAAARLQRYFPGLDIVVRPHVALSPAPPSAALSAPPSRAAKSCSAKVRVALIGAIGSHKGYKVLLRCARDAAARRLPLEFVVIGYTENDRPLLRTGRVEVTGRYVDVEIPHLLRREQPDLVFSASVWPETWCYTLDHALAGGFPVVAFDVGAIAERLRALGDPTLLPLDLEARHINERLLAVGTHGNTKPYVQTSRSDAGDVTNMKPNGDIKAMKPQDAEAQQEEGLSASVQVLPFPPGLYLFSVTSAMPTAEGSNGALRLPAIHVGLGPGVRSEHVEFVAGPSTEGAWLFARGDVLVAKVNGAGATLILTSVRAANGDVLSIEVERLEARSQMERAPAAADIRPTIQAPVAASEPATLVSRPAANGKGDVAVPLQIRAHIRSRGDMNFTDAPWAGRVAPGLWIESFGVRPLELLAAQDIEYKALTGSGFETPWLSEDKMCGTKGMSVPLVGFAVRLRGPAGTEYDCEYSGYFQSGATVGPLRNGAPCRSTVANDPLEGIQVRLVRRSQARTGAGDFVTPASSAVPKVRRRSPSDAPVARARPDQSPQAARRP
jgi:GT2 family glycosyltransferase